MYEWKEEYRIGIPSIDKQHKHLFELGEQVYIVLNDSVHNDKYDNIYVLIKELISYTKNHFKDEEDYMKKIAYPKLLNQMIDHLSFIEEMEKVDLGKIEFNQEQYLKELLDFLRKWLVNHIIEKDTLIATYDSVSK